MRKSLGAVIGASLLFTLTSAAHAQVDLTGANLTYPDAAGNYTGTYWNTLGGDSWYNLYLSTTPDGMGIINPGDGTSTSLNRSLDAGSHIYYMFVQPGTLGPWAMNLFFGSTQTLGISAKGAIGSASFEANGAPCTLPVDSGTCVPGAGSLSYTEGGSTVALTSIEWFSPSTDQVGPMTSASGGGADYMGAMTLTVTTGTTVTPEPFSMVFLGTGLAGIAAARRRRKQKAELV